MKRGNSPLVLCLFGILPVVWLGLLIAPAAHGGLPEIVARFPAAMSDPFHIELCKDSLPCCAQCYSCTTLFPRKAGRVIAIFMIFLVLHVQRHLPISFPFYKTF